ncbi:hypothetical protein L596_003965 [Steinernema carpocapsae]|uniref:Uncharacterized protein n=2 Tax=Steinernema carpocapsae TaxID=34508 RepID=A0A4U8UVT5_STECR|nr:hypothetical protein L596_003965 [Steinernema carpocapsae]
MLSLCPCCVKHGSPDMDEQINGFSAPVRADSPVVIEPLPASLGPRLNEIVVQRLDATQGDGVTSSNNKWTKFEDAPDFGNKTMPLSNASERKPPPLNIDNNIVVQPLSTPAKREEYNRNRPHALAMTSHQILAMSEDERDEKIYKYLSPDETWNVKEALRRIPPALDISTTDNVEIVDRHDNIDELEEKRTFYMNLSDNDFLKTPLAQIQSFFPYLSAGEIIDAYSRIDQLKKKETAVPDFKISDESNEFLRSLWAPFSLNLNNDTIVVNESNKQSVLDARRILAFASDSQLSTLSNETMKKLESFFTIDEMKYLWLKKNASIGTE